MPGPKCCVDNCNNSSYKSRSHGSSFAFHRFPKIPELREEWLERCGKPLHFKTDFAFVCSAHFKEEDYIRDLQAELLGYPGKRKLKPEAIPTLNLPYQDFEEENISPEEKERLEREKHKQLIQQCLNDNGELKEHKEVVSFEMFKKLNYTPGRKGRPRTLGNSLKRNRRRNNQLSYSSHVYTQETNHHQSLTNRSSSDCVINLESGEEGEETIYIIDDPITFKDLFNTGGKIEPEVTAMSADDTSRMFESQGSEDNQYLKSRVEKLENKVNEQKKIICSLKRQILREKKMMEKIYLATNSGASTSPKQKTAFNYDERARRALLDIYALAPESYERFAKALNFPLKAVISNWDPALYPPSQKTPGCRESDSYDDHDIVEEEYVIESIEC